MYPPCCDEREGLSKHATTLMFIRQHGRTKVFELSSMSSPGGVHEVTEGERGVPPGVRPTVAVKGPQATEARRANERGMASPARTSKSSSV